MGICAGDMPSPPFSPVYRPFPGKACSYDCGSFTFLGSSCAKHALVLSPKRKCYRHLAGVRAGKWHEGESFSGILLRKGLWTGGPKAPIPLRPAHVFISTCKPLTAGCSTTCKPPILITHLLVKMPRREASVKSIQETQGDCLKCALGFA